MLRRAHSFGILMAGLLVAIAAACSQPAAGTSGPAGTAGVGAGTAGTATAAPGVATARPQGSGAAVGTSKPACDLLHIADIDEITGGRVESSEGGRADVAYENNCVWLFKGNAWVLVLGIQASGGARAYDLMFEYEGGTPVDGLADRAFIGEVSDSLFALAGDVLIDIQFVAPDEADDVERRLAQRVLTWFGG